jgi:tetratricopeptide (TPR) repeat protein
MNRVNPAVFPLLIFVFFGFQGSAQVNEICSRTGEMPSLGDSYGYIPYLYGKVILHGFDPNAKLPKVIVSLIERGRPEKRLILDKTGNYCFRRTSEDTESTLIVTLEGAEVGRKHITALGPAQQREDFEVSAGPAQKQAAPGTISAKYSYPPNPRTEELYKKALEAEKNKDQGQLVNHLKEIVEIDPADFIAWAKLGSIHFERKSFSDSESAFRKSLDLKPEYVPAMITLGRVYIAQVKTEPAIQILVKATTLEPKSAKAYHALGTAYLQAKKGSLGVDALNKAIELDPVGSAEGHLLMAVLYDRAGAKDLAAMEYKKFLEKVPEHKNKNQYKRYIDENLKN